MIYQFDPYREDLLLAVRKLAELAKIDEIKIRSVVTVETKNEDLARILDFMMPRERVLEFSGTLMSSTDVRDTWQRDEAALLEESLAPTTDQLMAVAGPAVGDLKERIAKKVEKATGAVRLCAQCGDEFIPRRKDQILCWKPECRKAQARQRVAAARMAAVVEEEAEPTENELAEVEHDERPLLISHRNVQAMSDRA